MSQEHQETHLYRLKPITAIQWFEGLRHPNVQSFPGREAVFLSGCRSMVIQSGDWIVSFPTGPMVVSDTIFHATYECITCPTTD